MYLIFDASAHGKPRSYKAEKEDLTNWPRLLHLSWIVLGEDLKPKKDYNCFIKSDGWKVKDEELKSSHIKEEEYEKKAENLKDVLEEFEKCLEEAKFVFAHNLKHNATIVGVEYLRLKKKDPLEYFPRAFCLMEEGTDYCEILNKKDGDFKWPTLQELHIKLYNFKYTPPNNARADVIAATRVFLGLKKVGELEEVLAL